MKKTNEQLIVAKLPKCNFCDEEARYDGKTIQGPWAYMCVEHYCKFGTGVGLGRGQRLVLQSDIEEDAEK
jgi:hypothetical protein